MTKRILIGLTGAAGSIYGVRILQELQKVDDIESHLIVSRAGLLNVATELDIQIVILVPILRVAPSGRME